jgi:hypothetical protein
VRIGLHRARRTAAVPAPAAILALLLFYATWSNEAVAQLAPGKHVFAMTQSVSICPWAEPMNWFVATRLYHSRSGEWLYYLFKEDGAAFTSGQDVVENEMDGHPLVSRLRVGRITRLLDTYYHPQTTIQVGIDIEIEGGACRVVGCTFTDSLSESNGCELKCRPEGCEVRDGPAS